MRISNFACRSILASAALLLAVACNKPAPQGEAGTASGGPAPKAEGNEIVIGEYGSLTGDKSTFGTSTQKGVDLAIEEVNAAGGVLGKKVRVIVEDDQGKPEEAANAVQKLVNQDKVVAVIGEVASSNSLAAAPACQAGKVPMISPSSTNEKVTEVGDYIFRVCFIDPFQGTVMSKFARNTLKVTKVAILIDAKSDYSIGLAKAFRDDFTKNGGAIVAEQSYSQGDADFQAQLTAIKAAAPQAIFLPGYYTEAGLIARQARGLNVTVPILGGDGWDSETLFEQGGKAMNNCYLSNHYSVDDPAPAIQEFVRKFEAKYKGKPDALAGLAYDSAKVLFDAMTRAGTTDGEKVKVALAATKDFAGVTGKITIDEKRNAVKPAVVLKCVDGKFQYVETITP